MPAKYSNAELDAMNTDQFVRAIGEAWYTNDMETFLSMFTTDATIKHPLFANPVSAAVAADVLNGLVKPTGLLGDPTHSARAGVAAAAGEQVRDMSFVEAMSGRNLSGGGGRAPTHSARIEMTARIRQNRISYLDVHGFRVA